MRPIERSLHLYQHEHDSWKCIHAPSPPMPQLHYYINNNKHSDNLALQSSCHTCAASSVALSPNNKAKIKSTGCLDSRWTNGNELLLLLFYFILFYFFAAALANPRGFSRQVRGAKRNPIRSSCTCSRSISPGAGSWARARVSAKRCRALAFAHRSARPVGKLISGRHAHNGPRSTSLCAADNLYHYYCYYYCTTMLLLQRQMSASVLAG